MDNRATQHPPMAIITGEIGVGKSTEVARAFPDYFWFLSSPTALGRYERMAAADESLKIPKQEYLSRYADFTTNSGSRTKGTLQDMFHAVEKRIMQAHKAKAADKFPYGGLVFDEWSTLSDLIFTNLKPDGGGMTFADIADIKEFHQWMIAVCRDAGLGLILISHWEGIKYIEAPPKGPVPHNVGDVKYPAGPKFPIGTQVRDVCKEFDLVWQLDLETKGNKQQPVVYTRPDTNVVRKTRGTNIDSKLILTPEMGLREWIIEAGY